MNFIHLKKTGLILLLFLLATGLQAQSQKITLDYKDAPLSTVLKSIEDQANKSFFYDGELIKTWNTPVSISVKDESLQAVIAQLFNQQLSVTETSQHLVLQKAVNNRATVTVAATGGPVAATPSADRPAAAANPQQNTLTVSGTVLDNTGNPLPGAAIVVKNNIQKNTTTDVDGKFSMAGVNANATLVVSFLGFETLEYELNGRVNIEITLTSSALTIEEVVVTGFQRRAKSQAVGAASVVTERALESIGITSVEKGLAGKLPGVRIRAVSGRPGETAKIQIRGINTLTGDTDPLYVLDGMPLQAGVTGELENAPDINEMMTNGIGNIPPENIKSITILKDATAASIYGARAANGVVVIETKMGEVGADYFSYSGKFGVTLAPKNRLGFMNTNEKIDFERTIYDDFRNSNGGRAVLILNQRDNGMISPTEAERQIEALRTINTDWMDVLYDNAFMQSHNLTLSGGSDKMQYFASANYQYNQGALIENNYQAGGFNLKVNRWVRPNLLIKANLYSSLKKNQEGQAGLDPFTYASFANPYERPYDEDGSYAMDMTYRDLRNSLTGLGSNAFTEFNIVKELRENTITNFYGNMRGQLGVEWNIIEGLRYNFDGVIDYTFVNNIDESQPGTYRSWSTNWIRSQLPSGGDLIPAYNQGFLDESSSRTFNYTVRNSLEYNKKFGDHFVQGFVASEFGGSSYNGFNNYMPIYLSDYRIAGYPSWSLADPTRYTQLNLLRLGNSSVKENRSASFIGSMVYSYLNRYVLNANVRYDGVDILGTENQFSPLWSAGVKWNAHEENFIKGMSDVISRLALSVGYGYRGSINRSVYPFNVYTLGALIYDNAVTAASFNYGNPAIKWEKKREINLGLELSLYKGRFNLEARYFNEQVTDLLDDEQVPISTGLSFATVNVGQLSNKGIELSMRTEIIRNDHFLWEVGGNITTVENNLDNAYNKFLPQLPPRTGTRPITSNVQNYPINGWFGYKFSHVDPASGDMIVWAQKREEHKNAEGVMSYTYTDEQVNLMTLTTVEQESYSAYYLGQQDPKLYGGFNTRVVWKQFEFGANFVFAAGNHLLSFRDRDEGPSAGSIDQTVSRTNRQAATANRWRQYGDITDIPRFTDARTIYSGYLISKDLESANYLKCTELLLSWRAPQEWLKRTGLSTLRVTMTGNNLFTFTSYSGIDPELLTPFGYPTTPNFTLSLNVGF